MEKELKKLCHTDYNLLIPQDWWQAHYRILLIIFLKEVTNLNVNIDTCVYTYEYMDDCKRLNELSLPEREDFYSHLKMEETTDADYRTLK